LLHVHSPYGEPWIDDNDNDVTMITIYCTMYLMILIFV